MLGGEKVVHISLQEDAGVGEFIVYEKLRWWKGVKVGEQCPTNQKEASRI